MNRIHVLLIRHGQTAGNAFRRYIGRTDEPLSREGEAEAAALGEVIRACRSRQTRLPEWRVIVSPMQRCRQTAFFMFGTMPAVEVCGDLRECDFGAFEGKNYLELSTDVRYQRWVDSGGTLPFPDGEDPRSFRERCCSAFAKLVQTAAAGSRPLCLVVHGGTIMSILERWGVDENGNRRDYYGWHTGNGSGYWTELETDERGMPLALRVLERIEQPK